MLQDGCDTIWPEKDQAHRWVNPAGLPADLSLRATELLRAAYCMRQGTTQAFPPEGVAVTRTPADPDIILMQSEYEPGPLRRLFMTRQGYHRYVLRNMQFRADEILMEKALQALKEGRLPEYSSLSGHALGTPQDDSEQKSEPTAHERYLDVRRVWITAGLLGALFTIVALVLFKASIATTATPYVSLLSGLAGIALGWMFA